MAAAQTSHRKLRARTCASTEAHHRRILFVSHLIMYRYIPRTLHSALGIPTVVFVATDLSRKYTPKFPSSPMKASLPRGGGASLRMAARVFARAAGAARARELSSPASRWRVWAALESHDELRKLQLARLLQRLHALAAERESAAADRGERAAVRVSPDEALHQPLDEALDEMNHEMNHEIINEIINGTHHGTHQALDERLAITLHLPESEHVIRLPEPLELSPGAAADMAASLCSRGKRLDRRSLVRLLQAARHVLISQPSVIDLTAADSVTVVGDLHGCTRRQERSRTDPISHSPHV